MAEILLAASAEMAEAAAWYDERVSGLGERFLREAEDVFARIDKRPLTGAPWSHRRLPHLFGDPHDDGPMLHLRRQNKRRTSSISGSSTTP